MDRPQIMLSPEQVREVETLAALLSQDQIADYFPLLIAFIGLTLIPLALRRSAG